MRTRSRAEIPIFPFVRDLGATFNWCLSRGFSEGKENFAITLSGRERRFNNTIFPSPLISNFVFFHASPREKQQKHASKKLEDLVWSLVEIHFVRMKRETPGGMSSRKAVRARWFKAGSRNKFHFLFASNAYLKVSHFALEVHVSMSTGFSGWRMSRAFVAQVSLSRAHVGYIGSRRISTQKKWRTSPTSFLFCRQLFQFCFAGSPTYLMT